jgi:hypothetical protein
MLQFWMSIHTTIGLEYYSIIMVFLNAYSFHDIDNYLCNLTCLGLESMHVFDYIEH